MCEGYVSILCLAHKEKFIPRFDSSQPFIDLNLR
jgi:hypothetical protein